MLELIPVALLIGAIAIVYGTYKHSGNSVIGGTALILLSIYVGITMLLGISPINISQFNLILFGVSIICTFLMWGVIGSALPRRRRFVSPFKHR